ncbi:MULTISPECIES: hypothetical protein [Rhodopseudomonas]|uniref:Uncharacterized protein n=1 Tax=Rhodopseudomonas palustris TaxID=1076 RepID=A0A0D7ESB5_RHOPL|nr:MULTISPECIES: hypothetical protein [Rhodopseudomonas]KIZ42322.1 hypothetical protein OO17_13090 [Rhodopseudomonas palustris]MDF3813438.1 hypothetical protein [Rhodopseudomonas sp. BAL398]WOK17364.1 hypothetical protein RBJ75_25135 [Rhodopseudomonas sp. BAL398]
MTLDQFSQLAQIWGGDIERWPRSVQDAARRIAADAAGAAILAEQAGHDRLFATPPAIAAERSAAASFAVLQRIAASDRRLPWWRRLAPPSSLVQAGSLACSALLGVWMAGLLPYHQSQDALAVVSMVFDSSAMSLGGLQ